MRISDWSSDVCSSDPPTSAGCRASQPLQRAAAVQRAPPILVDCLRPPGDPTATCRCRAPARKLPEQDIFGRRIVDRQRFAGGDVAARDKLEPLHVEPAIGIARSEEHTSELQSLMRISYAVICLKKKKQHYQPSY